MPSLSKEKLQTMLYSRGTALYDSMAVCLGALSHSLCMCGVGVVIACSYVVLAVMLFSEGKEGSQSGVDG